MDFSSLSAEETLVICPDSEDDRWEFKSASLLEPGNRGELKKELGKQVSAFANSGGGNLVFGIGEPRVLQACLECVGRQPMQDYLATMVEQSVECPIRCFQIYRIPFIDSRNGSIFLIHIEDSPAAPHQAKDERQYYYRISGHSKPAPHFQLELLRNRHIKCIVEAEINGFKWSMPWLQLKERKLTAQIAISVANRAQFVAKPVGLSVRTDVPSSHWAVLDQDSKYCNELVLAEPFLFPGLSKTFHIDLVCKVEQDDNLAEVACAGLANVRLQIQTFSQNFGSALLSFRLSDYLDREAILQRDSENALERERSKVASETLAKEYIPKLKSQIELTRKSMHRALLPPNLDTPDRHD